MLPKMMLRVRKAVRRLAIPSPELSEISGAENEAGWQSVMSRIERRDREIERRLVEAERALNQLDRA